VDERDSAQGGGTRLAPTAKGLLQVAVRGIAARKLTEETCGRFGYGFSEYHGEPCHVAPYRDRVTGEVVAQKVRLPGKKFLWLGDPKRVGLFGDHIARNGGAMLVVTEGEIDALSVSQVMHKGFPAVSVPSGAAGAAKAFRVNLEYLESFEKVVLLFDTDEAGQAAAQECAELLKPGKAHIATLPLKDASEMLQAGRSAELAGAPWTAKPYRPVGILSGDELWEVAAAWKDGDPVPYPFPGVNKMLRGMRRGELTILAAGPGIGKSTLCCEISSHLLDLGHKVGMLALEGTVQSNLLKLLTPRVNRPLHLEQGAMTKPDVRKAFEEVKDRLVMYDCGGEMNAETILSKMRYATVGLGCTHVFLDNLSVVVGSQSEDDRKFIDNLMVQLAAMVREIGFWMGLVVHVKRSDSKGKQNDEGRLLSLSDLRGSGMLEGLAYDVIGASRDVHEGGDTVLQVLKARTTGLTGTSDRLKFDASTWRLQSTELAGFQ